MRAWEELGIARWVRFLDKGYTVYFFTYAVITNEPVYCVRCGEYRTCIYVEPDIWMILGLEGKVRDIPLYSIIEKFFISAFAEEGGKAKAFPTCEKCYEEEGIVGYSGELLKGGDRRLCISIEDYLQ